MESPDFLAGPSAVRAVCQRLLRTAIRTRPYFREGINALRLRRPLCGTPPATDTKRGNLGRWPREELVKTARQLRSLLDRETGGRVCLNSFISQYLPS